MRDVLNLFKERKNEVEIYFEHVKNAWSDDANIAFRADDKTQHQIKISLDVKQILLANTFLLLYNLVECTISGALEAIYKDIKKQKIPYDKIKCNIQEELISNIKNNINANEFVTAIGDIAIDILEHHPERKKFFSGNIDARKIKGVAKKYGFSIDTDAQKTKNGGALVKVKENRNDLAHGFISFKDCGKDKSIVEMEDIKIQSLLYVEQILFNIDDFVKNKKYLKS